MCCSLVKFPRVTLRPVSEILLVYCAREVEMCLIRKKHNICDANVQKVMTQLCTVFKITSLQFLCNCYFVGMHSQISVQNSSHTSVTQPQCSRVFPCRTPWGFQNRSPDNCHIFRSCCSPRSARRCLFQCRTCLSKV